MYHQVKATISDGDTESAEVNILGFRVIGVAFPASWDGANLTFQVDPDGAGTFYDVEDESASAVQLDDPGASDVGLIANTNEVIGEAVKVVASSAVSADRVLILLCKSI